LQNKNFNMEVTKLIPTDLEIQKGDKYLFEGRCINICNDQETADAIKLIRRVASRISLENISNGMYDEHPEILELLESSKKRRKMIEVNCTININVSDNVIHPVTFENLLVVSEEFNVNSSKQISIKNAIKEGCFKVLGEIEPTNQINQYDNVGNKHGYWEEYYENGVLELKGIYINGQRDGIWETYHENGQLYYKSNFINGIRNGIFEHYYDNGQLYRIGYFTEERYNGNIESYYKDGKLESKISYLNGVKHGSQKYYFNNGILKSNTTYRYGQQHGPYECHEKNGQLSTKGEYAGNLQSGYWESYYDNEQLCCKGEYNCGYKRGTWEYYNLDGTLQKVVDESIK
jgi:antitoxin component YwqK of YwqJK toxin-antitoxin module